MALSEVVGLVLVSAICLTRVLSPVVIRLYAVTDGGVTVALSRALNPVSPPLRASDGLL